MKKKSFYMILFDSLLLISCSTTNPTFSGGNSWQFYSSGAKAINTITLDTFQFCDSDRTVMNLTDNNYTHFITSENYNESYAAYNLVRNTLKAIPLQIDSVYFVIADQYILAKIDCRNTIWQPDYEINREIDGKYSTCITEVFGMQRKYIGMPEQGTFWRNLLKLKGNKCVLCVDRAVIRSQPVAIIYIIQTEGKGYPYGNHWTVTKFENTQILGGILDYYQKITGRIIDQNTR